MDWREHITVDPEICHGKPCIKNTRIMVSAILDNLAAGLTVREIADSYTPISTEDVQASVAYAAYLMRELDKEAPIENALAHIFDGIEQLRTVFPDRDFTIDGRLVGDIGEVMATLKYDVELYQI